MLIAIFVYLIQSKKNGLSISPMQVIISQPNVGSVLKGKHNFWGAIFFQTQLLVVKDAKMNKTELPLLKTEPIYLKQFPKCFFKSRNYNQKEKHGPYFEVSAIQASSVALA